MTVFRACIVAAIAAILSFVVQPGIAAPLPASSAGQDLGQLLHLTQGFLSPCINGYRRLPDGRRVPCLLNDDDDDDDDGPDDGEDDDDDVPGGDVCVQVGPVEVCK